MPQARNDARSQRTPWHLWALGIVGLLWNAFGSMSFMLAQLNVEAVMRVSA